MILKDSDQPTGRPNSSEYAQLHLEAQEQLRKIYAEYANSVQRHQIHTLAPQFERDKLDFFQPIDSGITNVGIKYFPGDQIYIAYTTRENSQTSLSGLLTPLSKQFSDQKNDVLPQYFISRIQEGNVRLSDKLSFELIYSPLGRQLVAELAHLIVFADGIMELSQRRPAKKSEGRSGFSLEEERSLQSALEKYLLTKKSVAKQITTFFEPSKGKEEWHVSDLVSEADLQDFFQWLVEGQIHLPTENMRQRIRARIQWTFVAKDGKPETYGQPTNRGLESVIKKIQAGMQNGMNYARYGQAGVIDAEGLRGSKKTASTNSEREFEIQKNRRIGELLTSLELMNQKLDEYLVQIKKSPDDPSLDNAFVISTCVDFQFELEKVLKKIDVKMSNQIVQNVVQNLHTIVESTNDQLPAASTRFSEQIEAFFKALDNQVVYAEEDEKPEFQMKLAEVKREILALPSLAALKDLKASVEKEKARKETQLAEAIRKILAQRRGAAAPLGQGELLNILHRLQETDGERDLTIGDELPPTDLDSLLSGTQGKGMKGSE